MQGVSTDLKVLKEIVSNKIKTVDPKNFQYMSSVFIEIYQIIEMLKNEPKSFSFRSGLPTSQTPILKNVGVFHCVFKYPGNKSKFLLKSFVNGLLDEKLRKLLI